MQFLFEGMFLRFCGVMFHFFPRCVVAKQKTVEICYVFDSNKYSLPKLFLKQSIANKMFLQLYSYFKLLFFKNDRKMSRSFLPVCCDQQVLRIRGIKRVCSCCGQKWRLQRVFVNKCPGCGSVLFNPFSCVWKCGKQRKIGYIVCKKCGKFVDSESVGYTTRLVKEK